MLVDSFVSAKPARNSGDVRRGQGRRPVHPGQFLDTKFLKPLHLSQETLAQKIGVSRRRINEIVNGRRGISADTALKLGVFFRTDPEIWLRLQAAWDVHQIRRSMRAASR